MTLTVTGKLVMTSVDCEKCKYSCQLWLCPEKDFKCVSCGATYKVVSRVDNSHGVTLECEFLEFQCIFSTTIENCENVCPAPDMFCKKHLTDAYYDIVKNNIKYYENMAAEGSKKILKMDESRKTWLIQEVAGIDKDG